MATIGQLQSEYQKLHIGVQASVASTLIFLNKLPSKLNPIIRPIMDSIKKEEQTIMQMAKVLSIQRRGAEFSLVKLAHHFGSLLPSKLPKLWEAVVGPLQQITNGNLFDPDKLIGLDNEAQNLINCLQVLEVLTPAMHVELLSKILDLLPNIVLCLQHPYSAVRHLAARCLGVLCTASTEDTMKTVVKDILPLMGTADVIRNRQGAIEAISCLLKKLTTIVMLEKVIVVHQN